MKSSILFVLAVMATKAWACPNLAGYYYACRTTTGQQPGLEDVSITQSFQNRTTLYRLSAINQETQEREEQFILADGRLYTQTHGNVLTQTSASCQQNVLVLSQNVFVNQMLVSSITTRASKPGGVLRLANSGQVMGQPVVDNLICE